jgi:glycogen debranching enzyme
LENYIQGTGYERFGKFQKIIADPKDGLIITPPQSTWMDADPAGDGSTIVTPRNGKAVEINALFYASLIFVAEFTNPEKKEKYQKLARKIKKNFNAKFWNENENCLLDVIDGDPHSGAIRPNQIFAISHGKDLLSQKKQKLVFQTITQDLLTPGGLRTLSPRDSNYQGTYNTFAPIAEKDWTYHQGTVWPWLIGAYIDSLVKIKNQENPKTIDALKKLFHLQKNSHISSQTKKEIQNLLQPLVQFCLKSETQSLPEVFSGNWPHEPGGTRSQAWSVGEVLRILVAYQIV